eukprot:g2690.t1
MLRRGLGLTALGGGAFAVYKHQTDDGFRRAVRLYSELGPVVVQYRWTEAKQTYITKPGDDESSAEWRALDKRYARDVVAVLAELQGMYCKYGQIGAGMTNTFSATWIQELRKLEDEVPPRPVAVVRKTIEAETGKPVESTFSSFDDKPLGSASIGQVHRATLREDGSEVAVKVQYPNARELFTQDMLTIRGFLTLAAPEQIIILDELERSFASEFDYTCEAANLVEVGANMRRHGLAPRELVVPQPRLDLTTPKLLVMELLPGCKLYDGLKKYGTVLAAKEGKTFEEFEAAMRAKIEAEGVPERYTGPSGAQVEAYLAAMRWRDWVGNAGRAAFNYLVAYPSGGFLGAPLAYRHTALPPNAPRMVDVLMRAHGKQLMVDGVFNADPHAGNFMMLPDERLGFIDYGATKRLTRGERLITCVLYAALRRGDREMIFDLCENGGYKSKHMDQDVIYKLCRFGFDTWGKDLLQGKNVQQFMDELYSADPWKEVADNLVMAQFLSIRLRSVAMQMNHPVVCSDYWGELAEEVLKDEGLPYDSWDIKLMNKISEGELRIAKGV